MNTKAHTPNTATTVAELLDLAALADRAPDLIARDAAELELQYAFADAPLRVQVAFPWANASRLVRDTLRDLVHRRT